MQETTDQTAPPPSLDGQPESDDCKQAKSDSESENVDSVPAVTELDNKDDSACDKNVKDDIESGRADTDSDTKEVDTAENGNAEPMANGNGEEYDADTTEVGEDTQTTGKEAVEIIDDEEDDDDVIEIDGSADGTANGSASTNGGDVKMNPSETNSSSSSSSKPSVTSRPNVVTIDDFRTLHRLAQSSSRNAQLDRARKRFNDVAASSAFLRNRLNSGKNGPTSLCTGSGVTITPALKPSVNSASLSQLHSPSLTVSPVMTSNATPVAEALKKAPKSVAQLPAASVEVEEDKNLTDDTCVVEAPSFIVPYVYERPPLEAFNLFSDKVRKVMDDDKQKVAAEASTPNDKKKEEEEEDTANVKMTDEEQDDVVQLEDNSDIEAKKRQPTEDYFDSTLGRFLVDLGSSLVQEFVQTDLLSLQVKKSQKDKSATVMHSIVTLKKNLELGRQHNEPFHLRETKCRMCSFRTESDLVMQHHLESPHVRNFVYRCNFCPLEVRDPHEILTHLLLKHGIRARLERPPAMHQCTFCLFEDNMKGKVTRHVKSCEKLFNRARNLAPAFDFDPPAKIGKALPAVQNASMPFMGHGGSAATNAGLSPHFGQNNLGPTNHLSPQLAAQYQLQQQQQQLDSLIGRSGSNFASAVTVQAQQKQLMQLQQKLQQRSTAENGAQLQQYQQQLASCVASLISSAGNQSAGSRQANANSVASTLSRLAAAAGTTSQGTSGQKLTNVTGGKTNRNTPTSGRSGWMASNSGSDVEQQNLSRLLLASKFSKMSNVSPSQRALLAKHLAEQQGKSNSVLSNLSNNSSVTIQSVNGSKKSNVNSPNAVANKPSISITPLPATYPANERGRSNNQAAKSSPKAVSGSVPGASGFVICEICDGYVKDLEQLRHHMLFMHKVKIHPKMIHNRPPLNCQKCQYRFFTDQGLERHLLGSHGLVTASMQEMANTGKDAGRCPVCGRAFTSKLLSHVTSDHQISLKPAHLSYKCTVCTATFGQYKLFENHVYQAHSSGASLKRQASSSSSSPITQSKVAKTASKGAGGDKPVTQKQQQPPVDSDDIIELDSDDDTEGKAGGAPKSTKSNGVCEVST